MGRPLSAVIVAVIMVLSVVAVGGPAAASPGSPDGHVGVPTDSVVIGPPDNAQNGQNGPPAGVSRGPQITNGLPAHVPQTAAAWRVSSSKHAGDLSARIGTDTHGNVVMTLTDDTNHAGRQVAVDASALRDAVGHTPELAYGYHENGTLWRSPVSYQNGAARFDVPGFSTNTVSFTGTFRYNANPASNGTETSYTVSDRDAVTDFVINVTGNTNRVNDTTTGDDIGNGGAVAFDVDGTANPTDATLTLTGGVPANTGSAAWTSADSHDAGGVAVSSSTVFTLNDTDVIATELDGTANWTETGITSGSQSGLAYSSGTLYVGWTDANDDVVVKAYPVQSTGLGAADWTFTAAGSYSSFDELVVGDDGDVYLSGSRTLYRVDSGTGSEVWNQTTMVRPTAVTHHNGVVYAGEHANDASVYAFDATDGSQLWQSYDGSFSSDVRAIAADADGVYAGSRGHEVAALAHSDGSLLWSDDAGWDVWGASLVDGEFLAVGEGGVIAYDTADGRQIWSADPVSPSLRSSALEGDRLFVSDTNGGVHGLYYTPETRDPSVSLDGVTLASKTGTLKNGNTVTASVGSDISLGTGQQLNVTTTGGTIVDVSLEVEEITETVDPAVDVNGNTTSYTGTLADGETVSLTTDTSWVVEGQNNVTVTASPDVSSGAPVGQVDVLYEHGAVHNQTTDFTAEEWTDRYNVSKTYSSSRSQAALEFTFTNTVVEIRNAEIQWNESGGFNSTTHYTLSGNDLTVDLDADYGGELPAGTTAEVRVDGSKVKTHNLTITVVEATAPGNELNTKIRVDTLDADPYIAVEQAPDGSLTHHLAAESWTDPADYAVVDASTQHVRMPNVVLGGEARVRRLPLEVSPDTGSVEVEVIDAPAQQFVLRAGGSSVTEAELAWRDAVDGEGYTLSKLKDGDWVAVTSSTADGDTVTFLVPVDGSTYEIAAGSSGASVQSTGTSSASSPVSMLLLIGGTVVGVLVFWLAGRRVFGVSGRRETVALLIGGAVIGLVSVSIGTGQNALAPLFWLVPAESVVVLLSVGIMVGLYALDKRYSFPIPTWLYALAGVAVSIWMLESMLPGALASGLEEVSALLWLIGAVGIIVLLYARAKGPTFNIRGEKQ